MSPPSPAVPLRQLLMVAALEWSIRAKKESFALHAPAPRSCTTARLRHELSALSFSQRAPSPHPRAKQTPNISLPRFYFDHSSQNNVYDTGQTTNKDFSTTLIVSLAFH